MAQAMHFFPKSSPGCGVPDSKCLPCSGVSGRTAIVYSCSSRVKNRYGFHVKIRNSECAPLGASILCRARRNPEFSGKGRRSFSRGRNWQNEGKESFESFEEADILSSKNGPLLSLSSSPKFQATATPGPREKEIVELFRKVQAQLRERAAIREEKKIEASERQGKESGTVDSLLKLLRKHSVEQVKKSDSGGRTKDHIPDQPDVNGQYNGEQNIKLSDSDVSLRDEGQVVPIPSYTRPASKFERRSPVPRVKYQPLPFDKETVDSIPLDSAKGLDHADHEAGLLQESDSELKAENEPGHEIFFADGEIDKLSASESQDSEQEDDHENEKKQQLAQHEDLSELKLPELRALAKSRGVKGFSKMKKGELLDLLGS